MFGILTEDLKRCAGRYGVAMGSAVLAHECVDCLRRTWPASVALETMPTPTQRPCPEHVEPFTISGDYE